MAIGERVKRVGDETDFCVVRLSIQAVVPIGYEDEAKRALANDIQAAVLRTDFGPEYFDVLAAEEDVGWDDVSMWAIESKLLKEDECDEDCALAPHAPECDGYCDHLMHENMCMAGKEGEE